MDLQISDCLVFSGEYLFSILKHITPNLVAQNNMCPLPVSAGQDLAVTELDVRYRMGLPSHLLTQLGEAQSAFCSGVWSRADLGSSWAEGQKASASSCGCLHREPQLGSFLHQKGTMRRAREGGRDKERQEEGEGW